MTRSATKLSDLLPVCSSQLTV